VRFADVSPETAAVFRCVYALPVLGLLAWNEGRRFGPRKPRDRRFALIAGVFFAADLITWHHSIDAVGAGLATVLGNTQVLAVGVLAWLLLGERPGRGVLVAIPIVMVGVVLLSGVVGGDAFGDDPVAGTLWGLGTGITYAFFLLLLRRSGADVRRPAGPLFEATVVAAIIASLVAAATGSAGFRPAWPSHGWLVVLALTSQVVGWLLISISLPRLPAAATSILLTVQPVGAVFLGMLLLDEEPSEIQFAGVALIVVGVVVATWRRRSAAATGGPPDTRAASEVPSSA
jgi:drug/metabolite transporter (DMT)-like permease